MARTARLVIPGAPHHVVQRGNRRQAVFFRDGDREFYLQLLAEQGRKFGLRYWAYCLMTNHVHLIAVPQAEWSLAAAIGEAHRRYTLHVNLREKWTGYLWQGRFSSYPMDEKHLYQAVRYVEMNPVRAGIVERATDYLWSSAKAHVARLADPLIERGYLEREITDWEGYLNQGEAREQNLDFERHLGTGRLLR
jgi:putative transposase